MRNQKGITLVALIITIIVMLILAGITISMIVGDNGILNQAEAAGEKQVYATAEERIKAQCEYITEGENVGKVDLSKTEENIRKLNLEEIKEINSTETLLVITLNDNSVIELIGANGKGINGNKLVYGRSYKTEITEVLEDGTEETREIYVWFEEDTRSMYRGVKYNGEWEGSPAITIFGFYSYNEGDGIIYVDGELGVLSDDGRKITVEDEFGNILILELSGETLTKELYDPEYNGILQIYLGIYYNEEINNYFNFLHSGISDSGEAMFEWFDAGSGTGAGGFTSFPDDMKRINEKEIEWNGYTYKLIESLN